MLLTRLLKGIFYFNTETQYQRLEITFEANQHGLQRFSVSFLLSRNSLSWIGFARWTNIHMFIFRLQENTDFPREFMTWNLKHHQGTVLETSKELPLHPRGCPSTQDPSHPCTIGADFARSVLAKFLLDWKCAEAPG